MQARLATTAPFRNLIDAVEKLVDAVRITISQENGMSCSEMDSSHVALTHFILNPTMFESWQVTKPQTFGINLTALLKILKFGKDNHTLNLEMADEGDSISIAFVPPNTAREISTKNFTCGLMTIEGEMLTVPKFRYRAEIQLPSSKEFATQLADYRFLSDVVTIRVNRNGIAFAVQSSTCSGIVTLKATTVYIDNKLVSGSGAKVESKKKADDEDEEEDEPMAAEEEPDSPEETKKSSSSAPKKKSSSSSSVSKAKDETKKASSQSKKKKILTNSMAGENVTIILNRLETDADDQDIAGEEVVFSMALNYLIRFLRASTICPFVCLAMSPAQPLLVNFPIFNEPDENARLPVKDPESDLVSLLALREGQGGSIGYYLAPRVEDPDMAPAATS